MYDVHLETGLKDAEKLKLAVILESFTGTDGVPTFEFHKNIQVYFYNISLSTVSPCGLIINYLKKNMKEKIVCALPFWWWLC